MLISPDTAFYRYWLLLREQFDQVALAYVLSLLSVALTLALPWPLKFMIDHVLTAPVAATGFAGLGQTGQTVALALAILLLAVLAALTLSFERVQHARVRERFAFGLRDLLVQRIYRLSRFSRQRERSGEISLRMSSDVDQVSRLFCKTLPQATKFLGITVTSLIAMASISLMLGLLALLVATFLVLVMRWYGPKVTEAAKTKRRLEGSVAALTQETVKAIEHVQAMGLEESSRQRYLTQASASLGAGVCETRVAAKLERTTQIIAGLALAGIAGVGGLLVVQQQMSLGLLTVCIAYMTALLKPIEKINELSVSISRGLVRVNRLQEIFDAETSFETSCSDQRVIAPPKCIEFSDLSYTYPDSAHETICHFSHRFVTGEATVLVGRSGSGKSTVLRLLLRLLNPDHGHVRADSLDYQEIDASALRSHFAVVMQDAHLYAGSVREVLTELAPKAKDALLLDALARVELLDLVQQMPLGLDSMLDETGSQLSGGQRTRLLLARALVAQRAVLVLDEPFANIDEASKQVIARQLNDIKRECILIIVTHEDSLVELADHVLHPSDWCRAETIPESSHVYE